MRESIWPLLAALAMTSRASGAAAGSLAIDGFNLYKDTLRGGRSEGPPGPAAPDRTLYLYRVPLQLYPGSPPLADVEGRKRTANAFKNHMLTRQQVWEEDPAPAQKRSSKVALSILMANKQLPNANVEIIPSEVVDAVPPYEMKNGY